MLSADRAFAVVTGGAAVLAYVFDAEVRPVRAAGNTAVSSTYRAADLSFGDPVVLTAGIHANAGDGSNPCTASAIPSRLVHAAESAVPGHRRLPTRLLDAALQ